MNNYMERELSFLKSFANRLRLNIIKMTSKGNSSHVGSALSIVDILTVLYCEILNFNVNQPKASNRDRFILSKGHAGVAVYATLAQIGFFVSCSFYPKIYMFFSFIKVLIFY